ncbi:hypothetical protein BBO99_00004643 [Phytophthora kernoviae]|uniref:Membrane transporter protein n=2 Tax=Phytophthora kernoviae TaxID=325452 RepID=A0A3R7K6W1_9STRA|nr:hypothetical protein G195_007152 [Phytophthora kernoviae 00238/432]KAG2521849.1 hypothetical protein JM16_006098 [Phytophthora kernoviae]KAG2523325.1 hypothetical protein JM18_005816 [Phytophthora kernoviae]RLN26671.1 hypothetical protein BBI17_004627 [Phytophthora kernoviae]RLN80258.1 hypothetical protein BBO99_00004643 [Phytophthora kernoviae]
MKLLLLTPLLLHTVVSAIITEARPERAAFYDAVGLACTTRIDCGYVPALACIDGKCEYCRPTAHDCGDYDGDVAYRCQLVEVLNENTGETETQYGLTSSGETVEAAYCVEKNLFSPFTYNDLLTTLIAFSCTALGAGGGIGGGGLLVPMYIFVGLNPKHAIPLSKVTIFGSAVAMYAVNFRRKHPLNRNRPLINFELVGLMEPTTLVGTVFGVMLNHIFPNWLILVLLVTLLTLITHKTILKGNSIQEKESKLHQALVKSALEGGPKGGGRGRLWSIYRFAINGQFPGELQFDYMAWFALVGCLGGFCGLRCVGFFVKKYKRESIMVYTLAATIGLSAVAMGFIGLQTTLSDLENGVHLGFHGICDNE